MTLFIQLHRLFVLIITVLWGVETYAHSSLTLVDSERNRTIPLEIYEPSPLSPDTKTPIVIINHGYRVAHTEYSFLAEHLLNKGYFVVSIQHDVPTDPPLPTKGSIRERRKPLWDRGAKTVQFCIAELKRTHPHLDFMNITLIGHSNGGDISVLLATENPTLFHRVISLDSLRMPFPRSIQPRILSLRACVIRRQITVFFRNQKSKLSLRSG